MADKLTNYPLRKVVGRQRRVLGDTEIGGEMTEIAVMDELLECGHAVRPREDFFGETNAAKRRCKECGPRPDPGERTQK